MQHAVVNGIWKTRMEIKQCNIKIHFLINQLKKWYSWKKLSIVKLDSCSLSKSAIPYLNKAMYEWNLSAGQNTFLFHIFLITPNTTKESDPCSIDVSDVSCCQRSNRVLNPGVVTSSTIGGTRDCGSAVNMIERSIAEIKKKGTGWTRFG